MKGFLLFVLKFAIFNFWFSSTIVGINLLNQKVDWQNYLGVFILCLSLSCVVYYVKNNNANYLIFYLMFIIWALYGIAALYKNKIKNASYNILDVFSKNFFGLFLAYLVYNV